MAQPLSQLPEGSEHCDFAVGSDVRLLGITGTCSHSDINNAERTSKGIRDCPIAVHFQLRHFP
jgi:hypothetical protein